MVTEKQKANLKRGRDLSHRPEDIAKGQEKIQAIRAGMVDPEPDEPRLVFYRRLHRKLGGLLERELDRNRRSLARPSRELVDLNKEFRQTSDRLYDLITAEGQAAALDDWLADLETRVRKAAPKLAKALGVEPLVLPDVGGVLATPDV